MTSLRVCISGPKSEASAGQGGCRGEQLLGPVSHCVEKAEKRSQEEGEMIKIRLGCRYSICMERTPEH